MRDMKVADKKEVKEGRFSKLSAFFTFRNTVIILGTSVILLIFVQIVLFRTTPEQDVVENNVESITEDLQQQVSQSEEEIVVITDTRIVSYEEYLKIVASLRSESKTIIPSGKLLKQWLSSDANSLFGIETVRGLSGEEFGGIPYQEIEGQ